MKKTYQRKKEGLKKINPRALAAKILVSVLNEHRSLDKLLSEALKKIPLAQHALIKNYCYGSLRWYFQFNFITNTLLHEPLKSKNQDIACLIHIGLYQILYMRIPVFAAISETVCAADDLKKTWAKGLLNRVLRDFVRNQDALMAKVNQSEEAYYAHPQWLIDELRQCWPDHWQSILLANNAHPPLFLRVNTQQTNIDSYFECLQQNRISATKVDNFSINNSSTSAIRIMEPIPVVEIPGFMDGLCSIQDIAGQLAAPLLKLAPKQRVLDACAAPGNKTCHILETEPQLENLIALDHSHDRLVKIKESCQRLRLSQKILHCIHADAAEISQWWDGKLFDRILLDAPCSATGVIRRHPDIKLLRKASDIEEHCNKQYQLLINLWPLLAENGYLLYSTCSVLPQENDFLIANFIKNIENGHPMELPITSGIKLTYGYQLLPTIDGSDGFYYALIKKIK